MRSSTVLLPHRHAGLRDSRLTPIGAHLATPRKRYTHHGIYVAEGNVIHHAGFSRSWQAGPIEELRVIEFAFGHPLCIVHHPHARYSAQQIVQRARSRLGEHAFHLLSNNREHFCDWCVTGHHRSEQVSVSTHWRL